MKILVTGAAGFIGSAVSQKLIARGDSVVGIDNLNDYYPVSLKKARLTRLEGERFQFQAMDLVQGPSLQALFATHHFDAVVHLGAQAGVRYSLQNPQAYIDSNITGTLNILEACRQHPVRHLVYASSSSVYGANAKIPFSTQDPVDHPVSLYAATKKSNELMAHTYSHLFGLKCTGLRFFTVYGPWGRPDMAPMLFADAILAGRPIQVFNHGHMQRDFTYIDDIVNGTVGALDWGIPQESPFAQVFNIGRGQPVPLLRFIEILESALGQKAIQELKPMQPGDVESTWADTSALEATVGYKPCVSLEEGVQNFAKWFLEYRRS